MDVRFSGRIEFAHLHKYCLQKPPRESSDVGCDDFKLEGLKNLT